MMVALMLLVPLFAHSSELGFMRISLIKGDVQMKTPEADEWGFAPINTPLAEGDQVWVPEGGRAELQLNGGTYLRLDQNSSLQILSLDRDSSQFYLAQGHAYVFYAGPGGSVIQVDTADASTRAFDRSVFRIDVADRYTDIAVFKGYVEAENGAGTTRINAGRLLSLGKETEGEFAGLDAPDRWERWNRKRDARGYANNDAGARFLPAELRPYSSDLEGNGRWVYVPEYGNVWTPTVITGADWSPYRGGRWLLKNGESVWVADEPWGWAPYHYGRWSFVASIGWCWVPPVAGEVHWGPGYVGWVRTDDYVAWVPLAPGEIYYGRGNYGRHSVKVSRVHINQARGVNVYRNVQVNNGVTVVRRNTFNTASPAFVRLDRDIIRNKMFVTNNISIGAPDIRPSRGSHYPSARSIPQEKLPPLRIRNLQPKVLKQERPLVREHDRSVLTPGASVRSLPVKRVDTPRTPAAERPAVRQMQPPERRRPEARPGSRPSGEQPQVRPPEQRKPEALPPAVPRSEQPRVQPAGHGQPGALPRAIPRSEQPQTRPPERRGGDRSGGPAQTGRQPQVQPTEHGKPVVMPAVVPKAEQPRVQPAEQRKPDTAPGAFPRRERPQVQPAQQGKPEPRPASVPRGEQPQQRPAEKGKSETAPGQVRRGEQKTDQPDERRKGGATGRHAPQGEKDSPGSDRDSRNR